MMDSELFMNYGEWLEQQTMPKGKKAVLKAGIELFAQYGFDGTSTSQIATQAGVSQATIFKYFKTKEALLMAIIEPIIRNLGPVIRDDFYQDLNQQTSLETVIHFIVHDRYQFFKANAKVVEILLGELLINESIRQLLIQLVTNSQTVITNSVLNGLIQNQLVAPELTIIDLVRTIIGQLITYFIQKQLFATETTDEAADLAKIETLIIKAVSK